MKHPMEAKQHCEKIYSTLINRGYMISTQRKILIEALCEQQEISDMESFWMDLRQRHGISWATVYTNIRLLIHMGWVRRDEHAGLMEARYQLNNQRESGPLA